VIRRRDAPRGDDLDLWWEVGTIHTGHVGANQQTPVLDRTDEDDLRDELRDRDSRRIRPGFYAGLDYAIPREDEEEVVDDGEAAGRSDLPDIFDPALAD